MSVAAATQLSWTIWQVDFVAAYFNSVPKYDMYIKEEGTAPENLV